MSNRERNEDPTTKRAAPSSMVIKAESQQCAFDMITELRQTLEELGLSPDELGTMNTVLDSFSGSEEYTLNTGAVYAFLISLQIPAARVEPMITAVRTRCLKASRRVPPPNSPSGEFRVQAATPKITPLKPPFGTLVDADGDDEK